MTKEKKIFLQYILPSPFSLAIILTFITFLLALFLTSDNKTTLAYLPELFGFWQKGFWELLSFAMQMMIMLVLGNMLALTKTFDSLMNKLCLYVSSTSSAALMVSLVTIILAYLNWGLALIFGALLARKIASDFSKRGISTNYPLIGAAAYSGLMIWHGGLSGSAPLKIAESGHFLADKIGVIPVSETIFSTMNIASAILIITIIPLLFYMLGKRNPTSADTGTLTSHKVFSGNKNQAVSGIEHLDYSPWFSLLMASFIIVAIVLKIWNSDVSTILNINFINLILLASTLALYPSVKSFSNAAVESIGSSASIMLQFPIYAGIMGLMKYSGLSDIFTAFFIDVSNKDTFSLITMISAGIVNFFVPSGGGQWAVQGPVIVDAAQNLGVPVQKAVMALAYGDELTNMIQPFWALPLLAITGLKAKSIIKYSFIIMLAGILIFGISLFVF